VARLASNLDGTVGDEDGTAEFNFTCPQVDPPAPIYFIEATQDDKDPVWTNRFALAAPNGTVVRRRALLSLVLVRVEPP